jgi:hypothetical protein
VRIQSDDFERADSRPLAAHLQPGQHELTLRQKQMAEVTHAFRKSSTSVLTALVGVIALVMLAVWQFYLFVVKGSSSIANAPGGMLHLWLAIGITLIACISFFVFSIFLRHDRDDELNITS